MKTIDRISAAFGVVIAAASLGAWAQASAPAEVSTSATIAASDAMSAKAVRQANRALRRKVYAALAKHKEIDAGNISITAKSGAVVLNGTVPNAAQIDSVAAIAKNVPGVTSLMNRLSVQRPLGL